MSNRVLDFFEREAELFADSVGRNVEFLRHGFSLLFARRESDAEQPEPRYPEYLWTEVWGLDNYHSLHPKTDAETLCDMFGKAGELLKIHERQIDGYRFKVISELDRIKSKPSP